MVNEKTDGACVIKVGRESSRVIVMGVVMMVMVMVRVWECSEGDGGGKEWYCGVDDVGVMVIEGL